MTNVCGLQTKFSGRGFLREGDEMHIHAVSNSGTTTTVKTEGGVFGYLDSQFSLEIGCLLKAIISGFQENGMPIFTPTKEWQIQHLPHQATVGYVTPRAIAFYLDDLNKDGYFEQDPLPEEFRKIKPGDKISVSQLVWIEAEDAYQASNLVIIPKEEELQPIDPLTPWTDAQIKQVVAQGSKKMWGQAKLGKCVHAHVDEKGSIKMSKGQTFEMVKNLPRGVSQAMVRITFISQNNKITGEFINVVSDEQQSTKPFSGRSKYDDPTAVGYLHEDLIDTAKKNDEYTVAGPYRLGCNYKRPLDDDLIPVFESSSTSSGFRVDHANIVLENPDISRDKEDEVICYITHISKTPSIPGTFFYEFRVKIVKVITEI